jgi:hypothetical protein
VIEERFSYMAGRCSGGINGVDFTNYNNKDPTELFTRAWIKEGFLRRIIEGLPTCRLLWSSVVPLQKGRSTKYIFKSGRKFL